MNSGERSESSEYGTEARATGDEAASMKYRLGGGLGLTGGFVLADGDRWGVLMLVFGLVVFTVGRCQFGGACGWP
jgi:hypothetical protein